jgi:hypothetical protein
MNQFKLSGWGSLTVISLLLFGFIYQTLALEFRPQVFFIPDLIILVFTFWAVLNIKQDVSINFFLAFFLIIYFYCFSPPRLDVEFNNNYLVPLKPLFYLAILSISSKAYCSFNIRKFSRWVIYLYPAYLIYLICYKYIVLNQFEQRPNFIFENNFEVPFLLSCFICLAFIYKEKVFNLFILVSLSIFLTGSRSGLIAYLIVATAYILTLSRKALLFGVLIIGGVLAYVLVVRGVPALNVSSIDRVQTFNGLFSFYNFSILEMLKLPVGFGIYQKVPASVCTPLEPFAEWVTGNFYNCDPIMLQSFFTRGIYQYGVYVLLFIPLAFYWEVKKRVGWYLAAIILAPILCASLSVGGFSNGLAFGGVILTMLAYQQKHGRA